MDRSKDRIPSVTKTIRQIELVGYGLKNTRVINRKVSLARVSCLEKDDGAEAAPPKRKR